MNDELIIKCPMKTKDIEDLAEAFRQIEAKHWQYKNKMAQAFANDMRRAGQKEIADKVEKEGLPVEIWAGTEIYPKTKELFIHVCPVLENKFISKQQIIASWMEKFDFRNQFITEVEEQEPPWHIKWQPIPVRPNS